MSCSGVVCGTGGFAGPKPGDPDNNSVLSAVPAYGGVDLTWTYPATNPFAVSHVIVYRGITDNPDLAVSRNITKGTFYFDKVPSNEIRQFFYWIQFVSSNGTYGEWIGPATATPKASIDEILQELNGRINEGVLAESLRTKLGEIQLLGTALDGEIQARLTGATALADAISAVQSETAQALVFLDQEITQRTTADEALVDSVTSLSAGMEQNAAAIASESMARATLESAVALQIDTVQSTLNGQIAGVETTMGAAIQDLEQTTDAIGALYTVKLNADGLVGGFGAYNDGKTVQAGFDVDTFWVGRTQEDQRKPFVIDGGSVFLSNTVVPTIQSDNYIPGSSGWKIRKEGPAEFQEVIIRGSGTFSGDLQAAGGTFNGIVSANSVRAALGNAVYFSFTSPGAQSFTIPTGMDVTTIRITIEGAKGGGGGGSGAYLTYTTTTWENAHGSGTTYHKYGNSGKPGGAGGSGSQYTVDIPYAPNVGRTFTFNIGTGGIGGAGGVVDVDGYVIDVSGYPGGVGGVTTVDSVGYASGGLGGNGGTELSPGTPAGGGNGGSGGDGGSGGGKWSSSSTQHVPIYLNPGMPGFQGQHGKVTFTLFHGDVLVKATSYQNLITWLDTLNLGAVPQNARI